MPGQDIQIHGQDGEFSAYLALPPSGKGPAIVALQEIFGVNDVMRGHCDRLAEAGFVAICPDLFWRIKPGIQISDKTDAELQRAFELFGLYDVDTGMSDIAATIDFIRAHEASNGKVGAVGYCLGGLLAYLTACHTSSDATVGYYGVSIQDRLADSGSIKKPLLLHIAGQDEFVPPAAQAAMHEGLDGHALVTLHDYPDMDHAFARTDGRHFNAEQAHIADTRSLAFFKTHLA